MVLIESVDSRCVKGDKQDFLKEKSIEIKTTPNLGSSE
jgi:hypothetical protein